MSVDLAGGFRLVNVRRFKRGAFWPDGEARICCRCRIAGRDRPRARGRQAVVTALLVRPPARFRLPVDYCADHVPDEVTS